MADNPDGAAPTGDKAGAKVRLDKWLWYARVYKSRSIAQSEIKSGKVRVNSVKTSVPSRMVTPEDVLTITKARQVLILKLLACGSRRGPAPEAQLLYEDLTPPPPKPKDMTRPIQQAARDEGAGRPTKKQRREISRFRADAGEEF
ncbi:MAG: RNA-binding S4 domain-containing protein [Pseudomonadota bacterium]